MKHLWSFLLLGLVATLARAQALSPEEKNVVELPPYRVLADMLTLGFKADENGIIARAEVTRVTPNSPAEKRDIEVGDELIAINGVTIAGARYGEISEQIGQDLKPGQVLTLSFVGQRGFFGQRRIKYNFVIMRPAAKSR